MTKPQPKELERLFKVRDLVLANPYCSYRTVSHYFNITPRHAGRLISKARTIGILSERKTPGSTNLGVAVTKLEAEQIKAYANATGVSVSQLFKSGLPAGLIAPRGEK